MQYWITTLISFLTDDSILIPARRTCYFAAAFVNRENKNVNEEHKNKKSMYIYCIYTHFRAKQRMSTNFSRHSKCFAFFFFILFPTLRSILCCMSIRTTIYCEIYIIKECLITWLWNIMGFVRLFFDEALFILCSMAFVEGILTKNVLFGRKFLSWDCLCFWKVFALLFKLEMRRNLCLNDY